MSIKAAFNTPFDEQLAFFKAKLNLPSERWDDIMRSAHDRAFIVAGAMKADLLADLHGDVTKAIEQGTGYEQFHKDFMATVQKHGWSGWTGQGTAAGEAWRSKVIYQTNMATSYAAGRYQQLTDTEFLTLRPYWRYKHADWVANPRMQHVAWNNLTLPHDHPFWQTHFPPNGWGCHCRVTPVDAREYAKSQAAGEAEPPAGWDARDGKDNLPGVAKGFDYAPGASADLPLRQFVQDKLIAYPPAITGALSRDVTRYINAESRAADFAASVLADRSQTAPLWLGFVDNYVEVSAAAGKDVKGYMILLPAEAPRHVERSHGNDGGDQRPARPDDFSRVAEVLTQAEKIEAGHAARHGQTTVLAVKRFENESYRAVFEVLEGKRNRALALVSLVIKIASGS